MKLIELGSDRESFRTMRFNSKGLSIILGKHQDNDGKSTYNGLGKSLSIYLIHFCLGANSNKNLKDKLPDWTFYLKFSIGRKVYTSSRNTSSQTKIFLDEEKLTLSNFHELMLTLLFSIDEDITKASFRSLITRFLRSRREEYLKYNASFFREQDERALLSNSILLGLRYDIVEKKFLLKEEYNLINTLKKGIMADEIFKSIYGDASDAEIRITELEDSIIHLQNSISSFEIAEDYKDVEENANKFSQQLKSKINELGLLKETLGNVNKSLQISSDMSMDDLKSFIGAVELELGVDLESRLTEVANFHSNLINGREKRLTAERIALTRQIQKKNVEVESIKKLYDTTLRYLNKHGALEDYISMNQKLADETFSLNKIKSAIELIEKYKKRIQEIKVVLAEDNLTTEEYIQEEKDGILKILMDTYRQLTGQFYTDKKGGITVLNNEGDNKLRYGIDVKIQDDSSDGINEVRIFCFDILLLVLQQNHKVRFIFHDSRLFSNMDTHQRYTALSIGDSLKNQDFQYIMSMNQDSYDILEEERTAMEFLIVKENIILELSGDRPENKLLGINVDLKYE